MAQQDSRALMKRSLWLSTMETPANHRRGIASGARTRPLDDLPHRGNTGSAYRCVGVQVRVAAARSMMAFMSATAAASPLKIARATMAWPMLSSRTSGNAAMAAVLW